MKKLVVSLSFLVNFLSCMAMETQEQKSNEPALIEAARKGDLQKIEALLSEGVDINQNDTRGITPLGEAISYDHYELAKALIDKGADVNAAWIRALYNPDIRYTKLLLESGADTSSLKLRDRIAIKMGLSKNTGPHNAMNNFLIMKLPGYLKFLGIFICFLLLIWPHSIFGYLGIVALSLLSTLLFAPLAFMAVLFAGFSGSNLFSIVVLLLLGILGSIFDTGLIYFVHKNIPLKKKSYFVWILTTNFLIVSVYAAILFAF